MNLRSLMLVATSCAFAMAACSSSNSSSGSGPMPPSSGMARVRFAEGAPSLEAIINGVPQDIGAAYLRVNGETVDSQFNYGAITSFLSIAPGPVSLAALNELGYRVGPVKSAALSAGKRYTVVLVGNYPSYQALTFEEPASATGAQLSLYQASPARTTVDFGRFMASSHSRYQRLGSATLGDTATVTLGASVSNVGGYAGQGIQPFAGGAVTPAQIDAFDKRNALPFHNAVRLSLFLFDVKPGSSGGPVFGSLDP